MAVPSCFEELFSNLISKLKDSDKVLEVSSHFGPQHSLEDMFSYLWELEETQSCLIPAIITLQKSDEDAERLRTEGNKYYQKKLLDKALKLYNLSIMSAPHPELSVNKKVSTSEEHNGADDPNKATVSGISNDVEYKALALGYANRSAVLLELKQYSKCINDTNLAFMFGYPKLLHSKLAERKAKCFLALGKQEEARKAIEEAFHVLDDLHLEESKTKTSRDALNKLLQECQTYNQANMPLQNGTEVTNSKLSEATKDELLFAYQTPSPPVLFQSNVAIPCLSDAVKLDFSESQGRYLTAVRDIHPGELLVAEEGYSRVLHLDSSLRTHCSTCLRRCHNPLPCPSCPKVIFCSTSCRSTGISTFHSRECRILPTLAALDMGKNAVLAYRIMIDTTFSKLKQLIPLYKQEIAEKSHEMLGFSDKAVPVYHSSDYRTIYHLVTNKEQRSVSDLFKRCAMAVILTWLLKESQVYFVDASGASYDPSQEDLLLAGCTLFVHMMNLPCNAHSITELQVDVTSFQRSSSQEIGSGAFGVLSLTNHSCNPSAARFSYGSVVTLRAIRFIPKGSEVTDSYGEHYALKSSSQRKSILSQQYHFNCTCEPCENNWPSYPNLSMKYRLKCLTCKKRIDSKGRCINCKVPFIDTLKNEENAPLACTQKDIEKQIAETVKKHESAYERIIQGDVSPENKDDLCSVITLMDKFVEQPCKIYFEAQETLKHYYDRQGSCVYRCEV